MKYIKKYEEVKSKYYIVTMGSSGDILFLLSILDDSNDNPEQKYTCLTLYSYDEENGFKESKIKKELKLSVQYINHVELFKDENIDTCFTFMKTYFKLNKYNL